MKSPTMLVRVLAVVAVLTVTNLQAQNLFYNAVLNGASESPVNSSPGTGFATFLYNPTNHILAITVTFAGLVGMTTASHIHAPTAIPFTSTASVATTTPTFAGFPLNVQSGTYSINLDLSNPTSYNTNPNFITLNGGTTASAEAALINYINQGRAYINIHTNTSPGGEIRGFLVAAPESGATSTLLLLGLGGLAISARRVRRA